MQPEYVCTGTAGQRISHPIETVFEAALYKLGLEPLCYPTIGEDGRTSYNFVQILKRFDIMTIQDEEVNEKAVLGSGKPGDKKFHVLAL